MGCLPLGWFLTSLASAEPGSTEPATLLGSEGRRESRARDDKRKRKGRDVPVTPAPVPSPYATIEVGPGTFSRTMRAFDEGVGFHDVQQQVTITRSFEIGVGPVTEALWAERMSGLMAPERRKAWDSNGDDMVDDLGPCTPDPQGQARCVSWCAAVLFANQLSDAQGLPRAYELPESFGVESCDAANVKLLPTEGWRLPTEAELRWAWTSGKVASPDPESWEWAWDPHEERPCRDIEPCTDPIGVDRSGKRVALGVVPMPAEGESTEDDRLGYLPAGRDQFLGFRLARTPKEQ
jgi:formylglycine-generating enzyme required for sulfatase activity